MCDALKSRFVNFMNSEIVQVFAPINADRAEPRGIKPIPAQITADDLQNVWQAMRGDDREFVLGVDSLDLIEFIMALEEEYNIDISDEDAEMLITDERYANVDDLIKWIDERRPSGHMF